eukprot:308515_1
MCWATYRAQPVPEDVLNCPQGRPQERFRPSDKYFVIHIVSSESTVHCLVSDPITKATTDFKLEIEARPLNPIELRPQIELEEIEEEEKQEEEEEFAGATAICTAAHREFIGNLEIDHYYYLQFDYQLRSS